MSERVHFLLIEGEAAARSHDREIAHYFLERVLEARDADPEQCVVAWWWLSQVSQTPAEQRDYLEKVLAADPTHPEARRALAILDGRLKPEDILDPLQPVAPLPSSAIAATIHRYTCPYCGGKGTYDIRAQSVHCQFCSRTFAPDKDSSGPVQEQDFFAALPTAKAQRWILDDSRILACQGCGAMFALPPSHVSGDCPFCGSAYVVESAAGEELIEPEGVLPFQFDAQVAQQRLHAWLQTQHFLPGDLNLSTALEPLRGLYLPFWTFDVGGELNWDGWGPPDRYHRAPQRVSGSTPVAYFDLLVPGSPSLPAPLVERLADFHLAALVPYSADHLAGWPAELVRVPMAEASLVAHQRAFELARDRGPEESWPGEKPVHLTFHSYGISVTSFKLVLLPVWIAALRYEGQRYLLALNGQTGTAVGDLPHTGLGNLLSHVLSQD